MAYRHSLTTRSPYFLQPTKSIEYQFLLVSNRWDQTWADDCLRLLVGQNGVQDSNRKDVG